jgi:hypothetical protein
MPEGITAAQMLDLLAAVWDQAAEETTEHMLYEATSPHEHGASDPPLNPYRRN